MVGRREAFEERRDWFVWGRLGGCEDNGARGLEGGLEVSFFSSPDGEFEEGRGGPDNLVSVRRSVL